MVGMSYVPNIFLMNRNWHLLSTCQTSPGVGSKCERACSALCYGLCSTTNGAGIDHVAEEKSSLKNRPFVAYYTLPRVTLYLLFFRIFCHGNQTQEIRLGLQRQEEAKYRYEEKGKTPLQAALHAQQQALAADGIAEAKAIRDRVVKQRDESNARTANAKMTCKTALGMYY